MKFCSRFQKNPVILLRPWRRLWWGKGSSRPFADIEKDAKEKALEYYEKKTQKTAAEARVTDFGCYIQVDIVEDGKVALSLTYSGGAVEET